MQLKDIILLVIGIAIIIAVSFLPAFPQENSYHLFANHKEALGVPNFADVVSNFGFIIVGLAGLFHMFMHKQTASFELSIERLPYIMFFTSIILVGFGSSYYHLDPNNLTLFWDRLPISIMIMSLFSALITERVNVRLGVYLGPVLALIGGASVFYWLYTETINAGDLRFYALAQFLPILLCIYILISYSAKYTSQYNWWMVLGWYGVAKIFETYDIAVYNLTHQLISGHTLKHVFSTFAVCHVLYYVSHRHRK